jgi:hypothetical protein
VIVSVQPVVEVNLVQNVEVRSWITEYRGKLWLHAGKASDPESGKGVWAKRHLLGRSLAVFLSVHPFPVILNDGSRLALGAHYYNEADMVTGDQEMFSKCLAALERAHQLDPDLLRPRLG